MSSADSGDARAPALTPQRLFAEPPLRRMLPLQPKFSPDGQVVSFLEASDEIRDELELHRFDPLTGSRSRWLTARELLVATAQQSSSAEETAAERAERERRRQFAGGIVSYQWYPDGERLLIPLQGGAFEFHGKTGAIRQLTPSGTRQTDFTLSPRGRWLSYVRGGDLYLLELISLQERRITEGGSATLTHGIADFIAQEEMHRFSGHWWSPDEGHLVFQTTDTAGIPETQRYEFTADGLQVIPQRYPYAGADNARVTLRWYDLEDRTTTWLPWRDADEEYLARVHWHGGRLFVQTQTRNQRQLRLKVYEPQKSGFTSVVEEQAATWINLDDGFKPLPDGGFLWTAERGGTRAIYRWAKAGSALREMRLSPQAGHVTRVVGIRDQAVWFTGWLDSPAEQHLFRAPLDGGASEQITRSPGWHDPELCAATGRLLDRWSSLQRPPTLDLLTPAGDHLQRVAGGPLAPEHPYHAYLTGHRTPELGTLVAADGQILHYRLTRPAGSGPFPVVVNVYGGPGVARVRNEWSPLELQLFVSRGMGVMELDNRGSGNRGAAFEAPIAGTLGAVEVADQVRGVEYLRSLDWVDPDRIGVCGHSYGGYMTLMCLGQRPDCFKAGVAIAPVTDWRLYDTHYTERYLGTPRDNASGYQRSSVFPHLENLERPLLVIHGMADDNVLFDHSTALFMELQSRDLRFSMMTYPGSKHALQESHVARHRWRALLDFFEENL